MGAAAGACVCVGGVLGGATMMVGGVLQRMWGGVMFCGVLRVVGVLPPMGAGRGRWEGRS